MLKRLAMEECTFVPWFDIPFMAKLCLQSSQVWSFPKSEIFFLWLVCEWRRQNQLLSDYGDCFLGNIWNFKVKVCCQCTNYIKVPISPKVKCKYKGAIKNLWPPLIPKECQCVRNAGFSVRACDYFEIRETHAQCMRLESSEVITKVTAPNVFETFDFYFI